MQKSGFFQFSKYALLVFTVLSFLTPLWVFKDLLFPFITSKAFYLRVMVEMGLPFFVYILLADPKARPSYKNPLHMSVLAFFVLNIISAFVGVDFKKAMWGNFERMGGVFYLSHLILLYFYIVVLGKLQFGLLKTVVYGNIIIATALSLYGIFIRMGMTPWVPDPSLPRVSATFGNPIFFPSYLIPIMFLTLFWGFRKKTAAAYWFYASALLQLIAVFLSGTRGAVIGLIAGGFIAAALGIIFSPRGKLRTWGGIAVILLLALGAVFYLNSGKLPEGSMLRRIFQLKDSNTSARFIQWRVALNGLKDYPIFGTGAENYYVVGNKYYNPEIYKYDGSWFDKPHNYPLEVLVTNGILGFAAYAAIIIFCLLAFYKSWKWGALELWPAVVLTGGLLVYEIQNLTVFDTVSASMSFFIFLSFAAFLWERLLTPEDNKNKNNKALKIKAVMPAGFSFAGFAVAVIFTAYVMWAGNMAPLFAARDTNYGYAYSGVDAKVSEQYFEKAVNQTFNFDLSETASKYQEFAVNLLINPGQNQPDFVDKVFKRAIEALESVAKQNPNNPIIWQKIASLYLNYGYIRGGSVDEKGEQALNKAIELAPKRTEAMSLMLQLYMFKNNPAGALEIGRKIVELNPGNLDSQWQLSIVERENKNMAEAVRISEMLLDKDYRFPNLQSLAWLAEYYSAQKNFPRLILVGEKIIKLDPNNKDSYVALAEIYFQAGQKEKASELANKLVQMDPSLKPKLEKYLLP